MNQLRCAGSHSSGVPDVTPATTPARLPFHQQLNRTPSTSTAAILRGWKLRCRRPTTSHISSGQHQIERGLDRQAPHLRQALGESPHEEHVGEGQRPQPFEQVCLAAVLLDDGQRDHDRDEVDGVYPQEALEVVVAGRRQGLACCRSGEIRPCQQEAGEREEQRHADVEAREQRADDAVPDIVATLERHVRGENTERANGAERIEHGKLGSQLQPWVAGQVAGHDGTPPGTGWPASTVSTHTVTPASSPSSRTVLNEPSTRT